MIGFTSIKRSVSIIVTSTTTLLVSLACLLVSTILIQDVEQRLLERTEQFTRLIAISGSRSIVFDGARDPTEWLSNLSETKYIDHVHLYQLGESSATMRYFGSYNRESLAPIPARFERVESLLGARLAERYIEAAWPVSIDDRVVGYVYLRASRDDIDNLVWLCVVVSLLTILSSMAFAWLITLRLRRYLMRPIDNLVESLQEVARDKDYSMRLPEASLHELERLSSSFNTMLERIQQHIRRQELAEQQASQLNTELERQVTQRTAALRDANQELLNTLEKLHQYQRQLVEAEKMSSLSDMVAGIAHEVNTPVGLAITSTSILQDKLDSMRAKFAERQITSQQFEDFLQATDENLQLISRNIKRTADLITRFGQLAMDQFAEDPREFELNSFVTDVVASLHNRFPQLDAHRIEVECPTDVMICSRPGPLTQILMQLVQNSLQHAFAERDNGLIHIQFEVIPAKLDDQSSQLKITYSDNGEGIPEQIGRRIFDPFVTSKRGLGATGLGLHLVYNLVNQLLDGHIEYETQLNAGTTFLIEFPLQQCSRI